MGAEDVLYRLDPRKIHVVSGDIDPGYWELQSYKLVKSPELFNTKDPKGASVEINLHNAIAKLDLQKIEDANPTANLVGIGVGALAGLRFFGLLGAVGGAVAGQMLAGNRHELTVEVLLQDGRHFIAQMDKNIYQRLKLIANRDFIESN